MNDLFEHYGRKLAVPVITLILIILSFGLYTPSLGFYLDDWPKMYSLIVRGEEGIRQFYNFDGRPFAYWVDYFSFLIGGSNPVFWHFLNYGLRWLTGLLIWAVTSHLWPANKRETAWMAILFAVLPLLRQQSMGLTLLTVWACLALFLFSILFMILGSKSRKYGWLFHLFAILVSAANLFTSEYLIGIELIRPIILWFTLPANDKKVSRLVQTAINWAPYLLLAGGYVFWRIFGMVNLRRDTTPILLSDLVHSPVASIKTLLSFVLGDTLHIILGIWFPVFSADIFDFGLISRILALGLSLSVAGTFILVIFLQNRKNPDEPDKKDNFFAIQAMLIGLSGIILGSTPGWLIKRSISDLNGPYNDRFGFIAMFGACIFLVGMVFYLAGKDRKKREIFLAILVGFAVGYNFTITNEYKWSTAFQNRFYHQLKWRAPMIQAETAVMADYDLFSKMGAYPTAFALNLMYPAQLPMPKTNYWFYILNKHFPTQVADLANGMPISQGHWYATFNADSQNSLIIAWNYAENGCVWLLDQNYDRYNPFITDLTGRALGASNLARITFEDPGDLSEDLFGREVRDNWCYYFEKADLARQQGNWQVIPDLYEQAVNQNFKPVYGVEFMPFIEGFAHTGDVQTAVELTKRANVISQHMKDYLCDNWGRIAANFPGDIQMNTAYQSVTEDLTCTP